MNRNQKQESESFFLFLLPSTVPIDVVHRLVDLRQKQHIIFCRRRILNLRVLVSFASKDSWDFLLLWKSLRRMVRHLRRAPFRHLHVELQLARCHLQIEARSVFRVFVGLVSALLCHRRQY